MCGSIITQYTNEVWNGCKLVRKRTEVHVVPQMERKMMREVIEIPRIGV